MREVFFLKPHLFSLTANFTCGTNEGSLFVPDIITSVLFLTVPLSLLKFIFFSTKKKKRKGKMESELRHRDTKTTIEEDSSDTMSASSLNEEYHGDIKKDMRYSYGKTPDGKGLQSYISVPNLKTDSICF